MTSRFPLLSFVARLLVVIGTAILVSGVIGILWMLSGNINTANIFSAVVCGAAGVGGGLVLIAAGELVGVAFAIEDNTRRTAEATEHLARKAP